MGIYIFKRSKMTKGTQAFGKRNNKSHTVSRFSGKQNWHKQKKRCASTGHPSGKLRRFNWSKKSIRRTTTGTGRMRHLRHLPRRIKNGFREGTQAKSVKRQEAKKSN